MKIVHRDHLVVAASRRGPEAVAVVDSAVHARVAAGIRRPTPRWRRLRRPTPGGSGGPPTGPGGRDRSANFGPPAPPKRLRGKKTAQQEHKPRGPIKERTGGRIYAVDDLEDDSAVEIDDIATKANEDDSTVEIDDIATKSNEGVDDQDEE